MDAELCVLMGIICVAVVVIVYIGDRMQAWWERRHPPDDLDGCREDDRRDED